MAKTPFLSVILPVYSCPELLKDCLDSLLIQEANEPYEIILAINLDALEECKDLAYKAAEKDSHFKMVMMEEVNLAKILCRLKGVKEAKGKYITFIDGDDFYNDKYAISDMISEIKEHESDIVIFPFFTSRKRKLSIGYGQNRKPKEISKKKALKLLNRDISMPYFLWNKAFKKELFKPEWILFDKKEDLYEDCALTYSLFLKASSFYLSDKMHYCYVKDNLESATNVKRTDRAYYHLALYAAQRFYLIDKDPMYLKLWKRAFLRHWSFILFDSLIDHKNGSSNFFNLMNQYHKLHKATPLLKGTIYEEIVTRSIKK